jgi:hypothetical protein
LLHLAGWAGFGEHNSSARVFVSAIHLDDPAGVSVIVIGIMIDPMRDTAVDATGTIAGSRGSRLGRV